MIFNIKLYGYIFFCILLILFVYIFDLLYFINFIDRFNSVYRCLYGWKFINEVSNINNVYFGSFVGGVFNLMLFFFVIW